MIIYNIIPFPKSDPIFTMNLLKGLIIVYSLTVIYFYTFVFFLVHFHSAYPMYFSYHFVFLEIHIILIHLCNSQNTG